MSAAAGGWLVAMAAAAVAAALARRIALAGELAARAAHEVRGPLAALQLAVDGMSARAELPPDRAVAVESQLRRAALALEDLTAASRGARAPDRLDEVPVAGLAAQLGLAWRPVAAAEGRELRVHGGDTPGVLLADRTRLLQAAGNLLGNALEHGAGPVELRVRPAGGRVRIEVRDGGGGLPAPLEALRTRARADGRGRGLAIAAEIAERHGGRLSCAPSPRGAAVAIELPLYPSGSGLLEVNP